MKKNMLMKSLLEKVFGYFLGVIAVILFLNVSAVKAAEIIHCGSEDFEEKCCSINNSQYVTSVVLSVQHSNATCLEGHQKTRGYWKFKNGKICVNNGCDASFEVSYSTDDDHHYPDRCNINFGWDVRCISCDSNDDKENTCLGNLSMPFHVDQKSHSPCLPNETFFVTANEKITVKKGCRADFYYIPNGDFVPPPPGPVVPM